MNLFLKADAIRVDTDEKGFALIIDTDEGDKLYVEMHGCALDFYASVRSEMSGWVAEAESARAAVAAGVSLEDYTGATVPAEDSGYATDDPKHPDFHDIAVEAANRLLRGDR